MLFSKLKQIIIWYCLIVPFIMHKHEEVMKVNIDEIIRTTKSRMCVQALPAFRCGHQFYNLDLNTSNILHLTELTFVANL